MGAFSASTGKIYLSEGILNDQGLVVRVLVEEIGHYLDNYFGGGDAVGDEGAIFSALVRGTILSSEQLQQLKTKDDWATITLDGQAIEIEQATTGFVSGGFEGSVKTLKLDSKGGGTVNYSYEMYGIPDQLILKYEGKEILNTGFVSGSRTGRVQIPQGNSDQLQVILATNNSGTAWNYNISTNDNAIKITSVKFQQQELDSPGFLPIEPFSPTVDGNKVRVLAKIKNSGSSNKTITVNIKEVKSGKVIDQPETITIPAGQEKEVKFDWDTNGYAWGFGNVPLSNRQIEVSLKDSGSSSNNLDSKTENIKVIPKPVILVHGINSSANAWGSYSGFLSGIHSDWKGYAVNTMDTANFTSGDFTSDSIATNAGKLNQYINNIRTQLNAQHIDIVAHSKGGLISRQYIQDLMPSSQNNKPVVSHLLMLGTPNGGTATASRGLLGLPLLFGVIPGIIAINSAFGRTFTELTPSSVNAFNQRVNNRRNVPFSILAGTGIRVYLTSEDGDGWVPVDSALRGIPIQDGQTRTGLGHTQMTSSANAFQTFVLPRLALDPLEVGNFQPQNFLAPSTFDSDVVMANQQTTIDSQVFFGASPQLAITGSVDVDIPVPTGSNLQIQYVASNAVSATLFAPNGSTVNTIPAGTLGDSEFFRSFAVATPTVGTYKLRLNQQNGVAGNVLVAAEIQDNPLKLTLNIGTPDNNKKTQINATLVNGTSPVTGTTVKGTITDINGKQTIITLLDDGKNGDGQAADGIYGIKTDPLSSGIYNVAVAAQGSNFLRIDSGIINIPGLNQANVFLSQIDMSDSGVVGQNITYTFQVGNIGPKDATGVILTDTLPTGVDFVSASTGGSFNSSNRIVTFNLGKLTPDGSTTAKVVVKRKVEGLIDYIAKVSATEQDPDLTNNTVKPIGPDLLLTTNATNTPINLGSQIPLVI